MKSLNNVSIGSEQEKVYVLKWNCGHCGTYASFADGRCLNCANPFDIQEVDKISDKHFQKITDSEIQHQVFEMMGWFCSSCSGYNRNLSRENYNKGNIDCHCDSCGNSLNVEEDGDYILKDGPSASTPAGAVRAMVQRNLRIIGEIQARKAGRILDGMNKVSGIKNVAVSSVSPLVSTVGKSYRSKLMSELEKKHPKWYWGAGTGAVFLAAFLAYKGFEEKDVTIYIDGFEWSRNIAVDSVQRLSKSDWTEDVDGSIYQTDAFHDFLEIDRYYKTTGREYNHNSTYCYTTPESEVYIEYRQECTPKTTYSQSCTATSGGGVSCVSVPTIITDCVSIPENKTRYYDAEHCKYSDFQVNDWSYDRNLPTSGKSQDNPAPYWYEFKPVGNNYDLGSERESGRTEKYTIHVSYNDGEDTDILEIPQSTWKILNVSTECSAKASFLLGVNIETINWDQCSR